MLGENYAKKEEICQKLLAKNPLCRNFSEYIRLDVTKPMQIFMGIGVAAGKNGLSRGLPIDFLNMLIPAIELRKIMGEDTKIHLLIADHMAELLVDAEHRGDLKKIVKCYKAQIAKIVSKLGLTEHVIVHLSSDIVKDPAFKEILVKIKNSELDPDKAPLAVKVLTRAKKSKTVPACRGYNTDNYFYFVNQTSLVKYFHEKYGCQVKLGWSASGEEFKIRYSELLDEPHFDEFYQEVFPRDRMSFLYADSGHEVTDDKAAVPYTDSVKQKGNRILFSCPQEITGLQPHPSSALARNIQFYSQYLRLDLNKIRALGEISAQEYELMVQAKEPMEALTDDIVKLTIENIPQSVTPAWILQQKALPTSFLMEHDNNKHRRLLDAMDRGLIGNGL